WGCSTYFCFYQAEDGIRYFHVTGVQTCALPIYAAFFQFHSVRHPVQSSVHAAIASRDSARNENAVCQSGDHAQRGDGWSWMVEQYGCPIAAWSCESSQN